MVLRGSGATTPFPLVEVAGSGSGIGAEGRFDGGTGSTWLRLSETGSIDIVSSV